MEGVSEASATTGRTATLAAQRAFTVTPFQRLARTHAVSAMSDAMVTAAKVELLNTLPDQLAGELSARYGVEVDDQLIREPIEAILRRLAEYDPDDDAPSDGDFEQPDDPPFAEEDDD